jgi:hemerythrin superfamily protein
MDVVTRITKDHRELEEMIGKVTSGKGEDQRGAFERLCMTLLAHEHAEEQKVYPELSKVSEGQAKEKVHHATEEQHQTELMVQQLREMGPEAKEFRAMFDKMAKAVRQHMTEEENELLPRLAEAVDAERLGELGRVFAEARDAELGGGARAGS